MRCVPSKHDFGEKLMKFPAHFSSGTDHLAEVLSETVNTDHLRVRAPCLFLDWPEMPDEIICLPVTFVIPH